MTGITLEALESWCQDALTLLPTPELPASFIEQRRATVERHSGTKLLYQIAEDLAEGIGELPLEERETADRSLREKHGFGYKLFTEKKLKRVRTILRKGRISNDDEFREMSAISSDTEVGVELRKLVDELLVVYETQRMQAPDKASVTTLKRAPGSTD